MLHDFNSKTNLSRTQICVRNFYGQLPPFGMASERSKQKKKFLQTIGYKVKSARELKGFSQFQLGIEAEIPKNQIGRIERGEINTSIFTLKRIADSLGVNVVEFFQT